MKAYQLRVDDLPKLIARAGEGREVWAPVRHDDLTLFERIKSADEIDLETQNARIPLRSLFQPVQESLFAFRKRQEDVTIAAASDGQRPRLIFGARLCDTAALDYLDHAFGSPPADVPYQRRRERDLVLAVTCARARPYCFCELAAQALSRPRGADWVLTRVDDFYLVEALTESGQRLAESLRDLLTEADEQLVEAATAKRAALAEQVSKSAHFTTENLAKRLSDAWASPVWERESERCLGCGICTYLCPSCQCFDICDRAGILGGERYRCYDTCQFAAYTKMASGENPRPTQKERLRNRVLHKFSYSSDRFGLISCVGCGRCVYLCAVGIDIREVVEAALKEGVPVE